MCTLRNRRSKLDVDHPEGVCPFQTQATQPPHNLNAASPPQSNIGHESDASMASRVTALPLPSPKLQPPTPAPAPAPPPEPTIEETVMKTFGILVGYCPSSNDKSCYHLRSLIGSRCEEYGLNIGLDLQREDAADRYHATLATTTAPTHATPANTSDAATQTPAAAASGTTTEAATQTATQRYTEATTLTNPP